MAYQSYPGEPGDSLSHEKLAALRLPRLKGKTFLDVGCNEGFFCGFAEFSGASRAVGIDISEQAINAAKRRFPNCEFLCQSWNDSILERFDCILLASSIHYADNYKALIDRLMSLLNPDGVLIIEMGVTEEPDSTWTAVNCAIDTRTFPSQLKVTEMLADYAWKNLGVSVKQKGDPLERFVYHVTAKRPYMLLAMSKPGSGKSLLATELQTHSTLLCVCGDQIYKEIATGQLNSSPGLHQLCQQMFAPEKILGLAEKIFEDDHLATEMCDILATQARSMNCYIDTYVPESRHALVTSEMYKLGFYPAVIDFPRGYRPITLNIYRKNTQDYLRFLESKKQTTTIVRIKKTGMNLLKEKHVRWHLDWPRTNDCISGGKIFFAGWAVQIPWSPLLRWWIKGEKKTLELEFTKLRRDVWDFFKKTTLSRCTETPENNRLKVGFSHEFELSEFGELITIGLLVGSEPVEMAVLQIVKVDHARHGSALTTREAPDEKTCT